MSRNLSPTYRAAARVSRILAGLAAAGWLLPLVAGCGQAKDAAPPAIPEVVVVEVVQRDVPVYKEWVGTTDGFVNATIRAQVQGYLVRQNYREGDLVRTGQVLFEIDPRTFEAALAQAKGSLDQAVAEVAVQQARWDTAKANLARIRPLAEQNAVSQKDLDDAVGMEATTRASVLAAKASVTAAQANVEKAQLELGFTRVTSPIDGIAGIAKAQVGDLVGPGSTQELTSVSTVNPIKVYINVSEMEHRLAQEGQNLEQIPLTLILADGATYPHEGRFYLADRQVDVTTGTIKVGSVFPNPKNILRPGQFGKIRARVQVLQGALLVPQRAVGDVQGIRMVAVVGGDSKVEIRRVKTSERVDSLWVITDGLQVGEKVVAEGIQKVRQGAPVRPTPPPAAPAAGGAAPGSSEGAPAAPPAGR